MSLPLYWNFPNCIGSIDRKHIRVKCPRNTGSVCYNYKKYFSIVLQAVSTAKYKFSCIDVDGYGGQADEGTFRSSIFGQAFSDGTSPIPENRYLPKSNFKLPRAFIL